MQAQSCRITSQLISLEQFMRLLKTFCLHRIGTNCLTAHFEILLLIYLSWFETASTVATSNIHSELHYHNFLYHNLPISEIILTYSKFSCCAVVKAPYSHITPVAQYKYIEYKLLLFLIHKVFTNTLNLPILTWSVFNSPPTSVPHLLLPCLDN